MVPIFIGIPDTDFDLLTMGLGLPVGGALPGSSLPPILIFSTSSAWKVENWNGHLDSLSLSLSLSLSYLHREFIRLCFVD